MNNKQYEEHVKQARLVMQQERYVNLVRLLELQIEYIKEQMNYSKKSNG